MLLSYRKLVYSAISLFFCLSLAAAQSSTSSTINGTVVDSSGAVVPNAVVAIHNPVSQYERSTSTDSAGKFNFPNVPFNPYHLSIQASGFAPSAQDVEVRSIVPVSLNITLQVAGSSTTVTVEAAGDLVENDPTFHTDVDRGLFDKLPLESKSSSLSSLVTLSSRESPQTRMGCFMAWATTRRIHFRWMDSP